MTWGSRTLRSRTPKPAKPSTLRTNSKGFRMPPIALVRIASPLRGVAWTNVAGLGPRGPGNLSWASLPLCTSTSKP
eukprot:2295159-Amphidinium_carterae.1